MRLIQGTLQIARGINTHKCHTVANVKSARGEIFQHIPDIDSRLEYWRGTGELFAPIFYPNGDISQKHHVFRNAAVLNVSDVVLVPNPHSLLSTF